MKMKLTKRNLDAVKPNPTHDRYLWDDEVRGFGLRVKPSGARSFFIQYRNRRGSSRRFTLGKFGVLAPDEARKMARAELAEVAKGADPAEERSQDRDAMTVRQLCRAYLESAEKGLILGNASGQRSRALCTSTEGELSVTSSRCLAAGVCAT